MPERNPGRGKAANSTSTSVEILQKQREIIKLINKTNNNIYNIKRLTVITSYLTLLTVISALSAIFFALGWGPIVEKSIKTIVTIQNIGNGIVGASAFGLIVILAKWLVRFLK